MRSSLPAGLRMSESPNPILSPAPQITSGLELLQTSKKQTPKQYFMSRRFTGEISMKQKEDEAGKDRGRIQTKT